MLNSLDLLVYAAIGFAAIATVALTFAKNDKKSKVPRIVSIVTVLGDLFCTFII